MPVLRLVRWRLSSQGCCVCALVELTLELKCLELSQTRMARNCDNNLPEPLNTANTLTVQVARVYVSVGGRILSTGYV